VEADLSTAEGVEKVVSGVRERLGGVDVLIHNVGGSSAPGGGFAVLTDEDWQHALNSNLLAAVRIDRGLLPWMLKQGSGAIIHISSIQRALPLYDATLAYAAAKAALTNNSMDPPALRAADYAERSASNTLARAYECSYKRRK